MRTRIHRWRASLIHLGISAAVAAVVFLAVRWLWYRGALFDEAGGRDLFFLVVSVDVVLGPLVTLIVYKPGKPGLLFDMIVIGTLQLGALAYGLHVLSVSRPVYVAFVKDRFELTRAADIEPEDLAAAKGTPYQDLPWTGPRLVGVRFPTDADEKFRLMVSGAAGKDIHTYPRYFAPYAETAREAAARAQPLAELRKLNPGRERLVDDAVARAGRPEASLGFLPLKTGKHDLAVIIDKSDGGVLEWVGLRPWTY